MALSGGYVLAAIETAGPPISALLVFNAIELLQRGQVGYLHIKVVPMEPLVLDNDANVTILQSSVLGNLSHFRVPLELI